MIAEVIEGTNETLRGERERECVRVSGELLKMQGARDAPNECKHLWRKRDTHFVSGDNQRWYCVYFFGMYSILTV